MNELRTIRLERWTLPFDLLARTVRLDLCPDCEDDLRALAKAAEALARPRAAWRVVPGVERIDEERIRCGGVEFQSAMLVKNLGAAAELRPYVATCGPELDALAGASDDPLYEYWLDVIKALALDAAFEKLRTEVLSSGGEGRLSSMNPGSGDLTLWPIQEQVPLFGLLGPEAKAWTGVELSASCLMLPNKSLSGIFFYGAEGFESCAYCERLDCPGRRVPYQPYAH